MAVRSEWASSRLWVRFGLVAAALLAFLAPASRAQPPTCGWGEGVTLPVSGELGLLIVSDGEAGALALTYPIASGPAPNHGTLRLFHVLEQGILDPGAPAAGVTILSAADIA